MKMNIIKKLPSTEEIIQRFPLSEKACEQIEKDKQEIKDILAGRDGRIFLVVGPCSAWPMEATLEYAKRLKKLSEEVGDKIKLILRVYIQKPRTRKGWTGPAIQPDPFSSPDIEEGITYCRKLMVKAIELGMPIADEALFTHNAKGFLELLSWVAIGARSSEDQEHRIFASAIDAAVGMKNPTYGALDIAVNSIVAAQGSHTAVFDGNQVETSGNDYAHLVLRGGVDGPNYHIEHIIQAKNLMEEHNVKNPSVVIDASHDNCRISGKKTLERQIQVVHEVVSNLKDFPELRSIVKGFMIESFLKDGNQSVNVDKPEEIDLDGMSITDPCLGWEKTEKLIRELATKL
ncbi:3-deoxy-7-phosphoheptulonate synthase [Candidatus Parcubacteria bacterium]|nr:3-deoxy-7-phosphoheptulonate synthase [Candidatus Parcubacteria bacterium]MBT3948910.1 3-deoxy-7-phosphoheptulonate synthase [Candidatus Parcubacteria bacterium]